MWWTVYKTSNGMDIKELQKLIKNSTAVLVMDNGEPSFVVLGYDMYKDMVSRGGEKEIKITQPIPNGISVNNYHERESEILDRLNKEILALKSQIEMEEKGIGTI